MRTLENALRLRAHRPGALQRLDHYLHQRTVGMIGSLSHLIRAAAMRAIRDGSERITKTHLDNVALDYAATSATVRTTMSAGVVGQHDAAVAP